MGAVNHNIPPSDCSDWSNGGRVTHGHVTLGQSESFPRISALGLDMKAAPFFHRGEPRGVYDCVPRSVEAWSERKKVTSKERSR